MAEPVDHALLAADEAAEARERLAERAEQEIDVGAHALIEDGAAPVGPEHADAVRVVDVELELVLRFSSARRRRSITRPVIEKTASQTTSACDQSVCSASWRSRSARSLKSRTSPRARRVPSIRLAWFSRSEKITMPGIEPSAAMTPTLARKPDANTRASLVAEELGKLVLELVVEVEIAVQEARAGAAGAVLVDGELGGLAHLGVMRQAEVVVGAHHHHFFALVGDDRPFGALERQERTDRRPPSA